MSIPAQCLSAFGDAACLAVMNAQCESVIQDTYLPQFKQTALEECQTYITQSVVPQATAECTKQVDEYALNWGPPAVIIGACWPLVFMAFAIATWRLWKKPNIRAILLMCAVVISIADLSNLTRGKTITPSSYLLVETNKKYAIPLVTIPNLRSFFLLSAASFRIAIVYPSRTTRTAVIAGCHVIAVAGTVAALAIGIRDLQSSGIFTSTIYKTIRSVKRVSSGGLDYLATASNVLSMITFVSALVAVILPFIIFIGDSYYVSNVMSLMSTIWLLAENSFELLVLLQKAAAVTAQRSSRNRSKGDGLVGASTSSLRGATRGDLMNVKQVNAVQTDGINKTMVFRRTSTARPHAKRRHFSGGFFPLRRASVKVIRGGTTVNRAKAKAKGGEKAIIQQQQQQQATVNSPS
ncbi:hypothetical protein BC832DRAFT_538430 [Gaertneriomyces semiglobifer]|nr:hypothetical protein BC832DRAFT_538430 [Gaertneriomyces semiglobifer]